jgi:hypothetical protein
LGINQINMKLGEYVDQGSEAKMLGMMQLEA